MECLDPGTWSNWTPWAPLGGIPNNWNDAHIIRADDIYHLFANNGAGSIVHVQSTAPFSGYGSGTVISDAWRAALGGGGNYVEGPNVVALGGSRFRMFLQHGNTDISHFAESSDNMVSWSALTPVGWDGGGERPGHGSVIRLTLPAEQMFAWPYAPNQPLP